jgi:hypothetical protein
VIGFIFSLLPRNLSHSWSSFNINFNWSATAPYPTWTKIEERETVVGPYKSPSGKELAEFLTGILDLQMYCTERNFEMLPLYVKTSGKSFAALSEDQVKQLVVDLFEQCM